MKKKVVIATPMYGGMLTSAFFGSYLNLLKHKPDDIDIDILYISNESLITRARNTLTHIFMTRTDATHLFFIDADIEFNHEEIFKMIRADHPILIGMCPKKTIRWEAIPHLVNSGVDPKFIPIASLDYCIETQPNTNVSLGIDNVIEINRGGTGCMLIKREVFEKLNQHVDVFRTNGTAYGFIGQQELAHEYWFTTKDVDGNLLSEDYNFCDLWRNKCEGKVLAAQWAFLKHVGSYTYGEF